MTWKHDSYLQIPEITHVYKMSIETWFLGVPENYSSSRFENRFLKNDNFPRLSLCIIDNFINI